MIYIIIIQKDATFYGSHMYIFWFLFELVTTNTYILMRQHGPSMAHITVKELMNLLAPTCHAKDQDELVSAYSTTFHHQVSHREQEEGCTIQQVSKVWQQEGNYMVLYRLQFKPVPYWRNGWIRLLHPSPPSSLEVILL